MALCFIGAPVQEVFEVFTQRPSVLLEVSSDAVRFGRAEVWRAAVRRGYVVEWVRSWRRIRQSLCCEGRKKDQIVAEIFGRCR
jgi:hypothetical protein